MAVFAMFDKKLIFIVCLFMFYQVQAEQVDVLPQLSAQEIIYYTEDYPPSNYLVNNELVGVSVETLKLIWKAIGVPEQPIILVPWARGYRNVLKIPNTMLFTMARTPEREHLFKWVGPIYKTGHVLLAKRNFTDEFQSIEDSFKYRVVTVREDYSELLIMKQGFPENNLIKLNTLSQALLMLKNDRVDLMILSNQAFESILKEQKLKTNDFKQVWQVDSIEEYFAFSPTIPSSLIDQFQQAFDQIAPERKLIREKYGITDQ